MGVAAIIFGVLSLIGMVVAFTPCLGSLNWLNIPFSVIGLILSIVAMQKPETKSQGTGGLIMCVIAIIIGMIRLVAGGGVL